MKETLSHRNQLVLLYVTLGNYLAQIPYYLHNYYFPSHALPDIRAVALLSLTLIWFIAGYLGYQRGRSPSRWLLISFLLFEALFYLHSAVFGALVAQMRNPSWELKAIFFWGYISGGVAAHAAYKFLSAKQKSRAAGGP